MSTLFGSPMSLPPPPVVVAVESDVTSPDDAGTVGIVSGIWDGVTCAGTAGACGRLLTTVVAGCACAGCGVACRGAAGGSGGGASWKSTWYSGGGDFGKVVELRL